MEAYEPAARTSGGIEEAVGAAAGSRSTMLDLNEDYCICLGAGRFLRAVLVPALSHVGMRCIIAQPRGTGFQEYLDGRGDGCYEVDTVTRDGSVVTSLYSVISVGSLGTEEGLRAFLSLPRRLQSRLKVIGVGVTEAGVVEGSHAMFLLMELLHKCFEAGVPRCSVINTDNVPENGNMMRAHVAAAARSAASRGVEVEAFLGWLSFAVTFHNSMVDRITSHREGNPNVPRTEPMPMKALVIEDIAEVLPLSLESFPGVIIRHDACQMAVDHALKLRIANATHTAAVHAMALSRVTDTQACASDQHILIFLQRLFEEDIRSGLVPAVADAAEVDRVWKDWSHRLAHPFFGLSTFFITQNAYAKLRLRLMPSVLAALSQRRMPSEAMVVAFVSLLTFIRPCAPGSGEFLTGRLDSVEGGAAPGAEEYASGLEVDYAKGIYTFRNSEGSQILTCSPGKDELLECLTAAGLPMHDPLAKAFLQNVVQSFSRVSAGGKTCMGLLREIASGPRGLMEADVREAVLEEVRTVEVIDLHTHLFPPSHGDLMLWGIDALLTYHYLVAEYFVTVPATQMTPEAFFSMTAKAQAEAVWQHLFVDRLPVSEAARGVVTTLSMLGLHHLVARRDLSAIRDWFDRQDPEEYCERAFHQAGVRYAVMTNIPFLFAEASHWRPIKKKYGKRFKSALRVDQLLAGDWPTIKACLKAESLPETNDGLRQYLISWVDTMQPEYFMASTPLGFKPNSLLTEVLLPLAEELSLPLAIKVGAHRGMNPRLHSGGDGLEVADVGFLRDLLIQFPRVKFLATFLSRVNQHELTILSSKFPNLHIYGAWWYCNTPSILAEITHIRTEMLGTAFTVQHSDARVLDQLLYKWTHSREVIGEVLAEHYSRLVKAGWCVTREEIKRDVWRIFGGSYEAFMEKIL